MSFIGRNIYSSIKVYRSISPKMNYISFIRIKTRNDKSFIHIKTQNDKISFVHYALAVTNLAIKFLGNK